jgi:hypothetical protein
MQRTVPMSFGLALLVAGAAAGCGSKQQTSTTPPPAQSYNPATGQPYGAGGAYGGGGYGTSPYGTTGPMGPQGPAPTATATPPPPAGGVASTATPLDPTAAGAAAIALTPLATSSAPGMAKEGAAIAGNFQEGQTLAQPITLQPGKCYTFLAAGIGPQELEIQLVAATPFPGLAPMMGDQKGTAGHVVLGPGSSCVKLALIPVPVQANWVIKASKGGGVVAGQAYSK